MQSKNSQITRQHVPDLKLPVKLNEDASSIEETRNFVKRRRNSMRTLEERAMHRSSCLCKNHKLCIANAFTLLRGHNSPAA